MTETTTASTLFAPPAAPGGPPAGGTLTARMEAVAKALDDSGEAVGAALVEFIANAMDLSELGRAIGTEADELRAKAGQPAYVPPQDVRQRLTAALAGLTTVVIRNPDADPPAFSRWQGVLDDPQAVAGQVLASIPGEAFGPKETTLRRLTEALAGMFVAVQPDHHELTGAAMSRGRLTDPARIAAVLASALGNLGTLPEPVTAETSRLRAELARVAAERDQAVDALSQHLAGAP